MNAPFLLRFKAFMIDYIFIFIYLMILVILNLVLFPSLQNLFISSSLKAQLFGFLMVTLPVSLYFIICDSKLVGQSFGKRKAGLQVIDKNGNALSIEHTALRTILKFLPWELTHYLVYRLVALGVAEVPIHYYLIGGTIYALIIVYILTAIFTKKKQALYDIIVQTQVVKVRSK